MVLLKNHLEAFRKRYAYHLRNWQIDGRGIQSHQRNIQEKTSANFRVILQPAGMAEKVNFIYNYLYSAESVGVLLTIVCLFFFEKKNWMFALKC